MGINLKSTAVKVYPSAFRGLATGTKYNPEARLNTEFNVTNLTNRLASKDNFVIAWNSGAKIITFNIHGYYFETDLTEFLGVGGDGASWTNIYAVIKLLPFLTSESGNTAYKALTLVGTQDSTETVSPSGRILDNNYSGNIIFEGVELNDGSINPPAGTGVYELHLLTRTAIPATSPQEYTPWAVPLTSYLKFKATDVEGLPTINNSTTLKTNNTIFAPTEAGTANQVLISAGGTNPPNAPVWSGATIGSTTQPIYLNGGVITAITGAIANNTTGSAATLTTPRLFTVTDNDATNSQAAATSFNGSAAYTVRLPATIKANLTGNVTGDVSGNAGTVTNGVYTTGNQTIGGTKTFSNTISGSINGNAATATNVAYSGLTGTVPTWNQNTTGNAATVTANNYSFVFGNVYSPLFIENGPGNRTPMIDSRFEYDLYDGTLYAPNFSGSLTNSVTFNNSGSGVASGTSYNGGTARTISYNTLGAAASSHTHGNISNAGTIGSTADQVVVTGTNGVLTTQSRSGIDSRSTFTPSSHTHDASSIDSGTLAVARLPTVYANIDTPRASNNLLTIGTGSSQTWSLPGGVFVNNGDIIRVEWSHNATVWYWSETTLLRSPGPGAFPVIGFELWGPSGGLNTFKLALQIGSSSTFDSDSGTSLTFRNFTGSLTFYVRTIQRKRY
jgi:hypothetical protein